MSSHFKHLQEIVPDLESKHVLDIGCGWGEFIARCPKGIGLDINSTKVEQARKNGLNVILGDATAIPFADNSFEFVNLEETIEHVKNPKKVLEEVKRVMTPNAQAYISVPNRFSWFDPHFRIPFVNWIPRSFSDVYIALLNAKGGKSYTGVDIQRLSEMHYFTPREFEKFAEKLGFRTQDIRETKIREKYGPLALIPYFLIRSWFFMTNHFLLKKK